MLKKPYELVHKKEHTNYYVLPTDLETLIATESVWKAKGWLGRKKEVTVGLQMLPINSLVALVFNEFLQLEQVNELKAPEGLEPEPIYAELYVKTVRDKYKDLLRTVYSGGEKGPFKATATNQNNTVVSMIGEGYKQIAIETKGGHSRIAWLAKSDKFGTLHISRVMLVGKPNSSKVGFIHTNLYDREIVKSILDKITGGNEND